MPSAWHPWQPVAVGAALLLAVATVQAALGAQQAAVLAPTARAAPVTLSALPLTGTTVVAQTEATTTGLVPVLGSVSTLALAAADGRAWDVRLVATSASGITDSEALVVALVGASTQSVTVAPGSTLPTATAAVPLGLAGAKVTVASLNLLAGCKSCSVQMELRLAPAGDPLPTAVYRYSVLTAP